VALHADGLRAVTASSDKTVRVWNLDTGVCLQTFWGHTDYVSSVALHADGRRVVTVGLDRTVRVWNLDTGACLKTLGGHTDRVRSVAIHPDGRRAVTGSEDGTMRVWDLDTGACLTTWFGGSPFLAVVSGKPLANGRIRVVGGCADGSVHFLDFMPPGSLTRATLATWSPTYAIIATVLDTDAVVLHQWHASSAHLEELARSVLTSAPITSLRFSLDGTRLQVLTADNTEHILDATTPQPAAGDRQVAPTMSPAWAEPRGLSPDGAWRAVIRDGQLEIVPAAKRG
jgi:WD40 repeat protein